MKLVAESGLWSTGPHALPTPLVAVLEVSGAVLSWTVDEPESSAAITFTDLDRADWLWRILGEAGHGALASAVGGLAPEEAQTVELAGVGVRPEAVAPLRRLAVGHWLRRWWPASQRDGIVALDGAVLDAEIAVITAGAQDFFTDDTFDSDVEILLKQHVSALNDHARYGDPRVVDLVRACTELAEDVGIAVDGVEPARSGRRDDYALAAGGDNGRGSGAVATGVASINWSAVPPGIFDPAEDTVEWRTEADASATKAVVRVELSGTGSAAGIAVNLRSGTFTGQGTLDADGRATFPVVDELGQPITDTVAWDHDWRTTLVKVGANAEESPDVRERVRTFARARLNRPGDDAFLAEILAAESDY